MPVHRQHGADVIGAGVRRVEALPAQQLRAPSDVGVFAVNEEIRIKEFRSAGLVGSPRQRDVVDHLATVKRRRSRGPKNILVIHVLAVVHLLAAPVQMPQHRIEVDTRGIDNGSFGKIEGGAHREQLAAHRANFGVAVAGIDESLKKIRQEQDVRIEGQNPFAIGELDRLILDLGEGLLLGR